MYGYEDYFDKSLAGTAYEDTAQSMKDYCALCEMLLEDYAGRKGLGTEDNLFSRGVAITEDEMVNYFVNHPMLREVDRYFYVLGEFREDAFSHIAGREEQTPAKVFLPVKKLKEDYGLTDAETVILVLSYMCHENRAYERVFGFLQDDIQSTEPTLGMALSVIGHAFEASELPSAEDILSEERGLFGSLFIKAERNESFPLRTRLILTSAALDFFHEKERETGPLMQVLEKASKMPMFFENEAKALSSLMKQDDQLPALYICGKDEPVITRVCLFACEKNKRALYRISLRELISQFTGLVSEVCESASFYAHTKQAAVLLTDATEENLESETAASLLKELLRLSALFPVLITGSEKLPEILKTGSLTGEPVVRMDLPAPDTDMRTQIWKHYIKEYALSLEKGFEIEELADCYEVGASEIKAAVRQAKVNLTVAGKKKLDKTLVSDALKGIGTVNFQGLAKEVRTVYTWEDISMTKEQEKLLKTACNRYKVKNRIGESWGITKKNAYGNGVSVLLYGPPGTGKTMSAQVVAREIGLPLYRVDTSQLFSKYIGETQKNLNAVFDEAEKSNVILFFDEADALFSKRTDVENSNDRHSNSEIAFLLQRIEEYKGMSLLATNYYSGFDQAFVRRITYAVRLEQPTEEERLALWKGILPDQVPKEKNIDFAFLAKTFELTGSNIKAILLSAAYMAGSEGTSLSMVHIVRAMKYEFDKLGMMPDSGKFGPYAAFLYQ